LFFAILTAGFVYELGCGSLKKKNSRQSNNLNNLSITPVFSVSHFASSSAKGFIKMQILKNFYIFKLVIYMWVN